jgi:dimethylhistidine N-methyltransferase
MKTETHGQILLSDFEPPTASFRAELLAGLRHSPKTLPCKFFYDARGSQLFDQICDLDEYYLTRTEISILRENITEIAELCGPLCRLVELGSGSSRKTRLLLDHLDTPAAYVPIDISRTHLMQAAAALNGDYLPLEILPVCADYNQRITLPAPSKASERTVLFFPGSTLGNFEPWQAQCFLRRLASWCNPGDGLLIGVDLQKSRQVLEPAYNDPKGITADFNLNLLRRANRELGADFRLHQFRHQAIYNEAQSRIEMHLVSTSPQVVHIGGQTIPFAASEPIVTEFSYKYSLAAFHHLACSSGWHPVQTWMDSRQWFSVHFLSYVGDARPCEP